MNVPESWLRSFCDPKIAGGKLADKLTMAGLEVEGYAPVAPQLENVVVAEVLSVEKHPNADKLSVCEVSIGSKRLKVVCGAPNVRVGMKAPLARIGTKELRGVASEGMLASARDLGLSEDHSGLLELRASAKPGSDVRGALGLDDHVLTFKLTPNRADGLSILGIAREVAALTGTKLKLPAIPKVSSKNKSVHRVTIGAPDGCGRFAGRVIRGVDSSAKTPSWMRERLERAGQRPISALVDVTNYVMLELGRPLHVYDLDKLRGAIDVRWGRKGEKVLLLNGQEVEVDAAVLCITDDSGPIGLAGIMGGESTKADERTRNVLLESAFFFPGAVQGRARRYGFSSDAAHRFERGVDFDNNVQGIERATRLVLDICGGEPGPTVDTRKRLPSRKPVRMRVARARKVLGIPVAPREMAAIFSRLKFQFKKSGDAFVVTPPSYRFDIEIEEDLIEEVARLHGFERIAAHPPRAAARMLRAPESTRSLHALRERLAAAEYREVINFSFVPPAWEEELAGQSSPIRLLNPINSEQSVMRTTLLGSLVSNVLYNHARKLPRIRVFEVGRVFLRDATVRDGPLSVAGVRQPMRIGAAAYGAAAEEQWGMPRQEKDRSVDFFDVKADLETLISPLTARYERGQHPAFHPGRAARVIVEGQAAGWIGELHPRWQQKYELARPVVLFELDAELLQAVPASALAAPSRYPPVVRDVALLVDAGVPARALLDAMEAKKPPIVASLRLFDLYQGQGVPAGRKSLAFRVVMQHTERTLTDAEADAARDALVALLVREFSATLRS
jgi:phenylalanyl-tRNA synthetase beta chain